MRFKHFLLNEDRMNLANRVGDIMSALKDFQPMSDKSSNASLTAAKNIVSEIRKVTRNTDPRDNKQHVEKLVDVGVMLSNAIEGQGDKTLSQATDAAIAAMTKIVRDLGSPLNDIAAGFAAKPTEEKQTSKPVKAVVPPRVQIAEPTSPGSIPPDKQPPLGGSTGDLKNL